MCPSPEPQPPQLVLGENNGGLHHFIRNERWDDDLNTWVAMAGTRLPDNKANRSKLKRDIDVFLSNHMRVRTVNYEVKEEVIGVLFGEGATPWNR